MLRKVTLLTAMTLALSGGAYAAGGGAGGMTDRGATGTSSGSMDSQSGTMGNTGTPGGAAGGAITTPRASRDQFKQLDSDRNGYISQDETNAVPGLGDRFSTLDANRDNRLDQAEFSRFESDMGGSHRPGDTHGTTDKLDQDSDRGPGGSSGSSPGGMGGGMR